MADRRKEPRKSVIARANLSWEDDKGIVQKAPVMIEDTSSEGLGVQTAGPLSVGLKIELDWRRERIAGVVRSCQKHGIRYFIGIQRERFNHVDNRPKWHTGVPVVPTPVVEAPVIEPPIENVPEAPEIAEA